MCNLPTSRGGSDSLRERPGYEYGVDEPEEPFLPPYWDNYGSPAGTYDTPESVPLFNDNDYSVQQPPVRVPITPRERQPRPVETGGCLEQEGPQWGAGGGAENWREVKKKSIFFMMLKFPMVPERISCDS